MNQNQTLIHHFYTSFKNKDYASMQNCYADDAVFNDPVFDKLNATEVKSMWEMLIKNGKDMKLSFDSIKDEGNVVTAYWEANYTFSLTGKAVVNKVNASFVIENGKIKSHGDHFNFYNWARQAFGFKGALLGWTSFFREKVRATATKNLKRFMGVV
ncbi:MAG: nuclear transport factor 2 family protein [Pedobacter sp.]|nr:MAG: nuclear transport factor 2 family protein [Pedobacter sp.]